MHRTQIDLQDDVYASLQNQARLKGISVSEFIGKAIEEYLRQQRNRAKQDLLALRGQVEIEDNWEALRNSELKE